MRKRPTGTIAMLGWTLLLTAALAGIGRLDRFDRTPKITQFDYYSPAHRWPQVAADKAGAVAAQSNAPAPPARPVVPAPAAAPPAPPPPPPENPEQRAQYDAERAKTVLELQPFRTSESESLSRSGALGTATLVNLNPNINAWFVLRLNAADSSAVYHLENPDPLGQHIHLAEGVPGVVLSTAAQTTPCDLWSGSTSALVQATKTGLPYAPLCDGRLLLRNRVAGHYTDLERVTDFLREDVWAGDDIVGFVRSTLYQDAYRQDGKTTSSTPLPAPAPEALSPAQLSATGAGQAIGARDFAIQVDAPPSGQISLGHWYPVRSIDGVYASVMQAQAVSDTLVTALKGKVNAIDSVEGSALDELIAFDPSQFELKFALGTDNPRLGWSPRAPMRSERLPGPDGIDTPSPLVTNGMVSPAVLSRVVATFAGGFKREHGAFKWGDLAQRNMSSHYGFIEQGVVFSKLQPGLATIYGLDDGSLHMETWTDDLNKLLPHVLYARQNGVALVEPGPKGDGVPGHLVTNWGAGNWSGSADSKLRTLRAGLCVMQAGGKQYLVHGLFSTATPSAMALVFTAYGCSYAMLLDMNAPEHSYVALYARRGDRLVVEHPVPSMTDIDRTSSGQLVPRFVGYPDNRDFFYLLRRKSTP